MSGSRGRASGLGLLALVRASAASIVIGSTGCLAFHTGPIAGEPKGATFAEVDGVRIRYQERGEGSPVVLVHGFASALETWGTVASALSPSHRVLSLDLKGFGWSDRPDGDYSPAAEARLVLDLMTARHVERAAVVAHSWGSSVALAMALEAPARVTRLALYDAWVYEEQLPSLFHWARAGGVGELLFGLFYGERAEDRIVDGFFDKRRYVDQRFVDSVERALERPGTKAAALAAARGQRFAEVQERYKTVRQPTLLLWGREDAIATIADGERLARDLPNARLVAYPRCGHFPMIEAQSASTADLARFLGESDGP